MAGVLKGGNITGMMFHSDKQRFQQRGLNNGVGPRQIVTVQGMNGSDTLILNLKMLFLALLTG